MIGVSVALGLSGQRAAAAGPVNTVAPALSTATPKIGTEVTCTEGTWDGADSYAYQWQLGGVNIDGETTDAYTPVEGDDTDSLRCRVTATGAAGSASANSDTRTVTYNTPIGSNDTWDEDEDTGVQTFDASALFTVSGDADLSGCTFAKTAGDASVSINSGTGVLSIDTDTSGPLENETITVECENSGGTDTADVVLNVAAASAGISFVAVGAIGSTGGTTLTPALPAGVQSGDFMLVGIVHRGEGGTADGTSSSITFTMPEGWAKLPGNPTRFDNVTSGNDLTLEVWYKVHDGSETDPEITASTGTAGWSAASAAWRGVHATPFNLNAAGENPGSVLTHTPASRTTTVDGALAVTVVATRDQNQLAFQSGSDQGFTAHWSGAAYSVLGSGIPNGGGLNQCLGMGSKVITTAGAVTFPTWEETVLGSDHMCSITFALAPA